MFQDSSGAGVDCMFSRDVVLETIVTARKQLSNKARVLRKKSNIKGWIGRLFQDGIQVARVDAPSRKDVEREINHYALMYSQDGPVRITIRSTP